MIKTKLIYRTDPQAFQDELNDFIADKDVVDIKYSFHIFVSNYDKTRTPNQVTAADRALVIYTED